MTARKYIALLFTAVLPGTGHFILRQYLRATALLFLFVVLVDGVVAGHLRLISFGVDETLLVRGCLAGAVVVWLVAMGHIVWRSFFFDEARHQQRVDDAFLQGQRAYLRGDNDLAVGHFRQAARLDHEDVDVRFYLASVYAAMGRTGPAKRQVRKCRRLDEQGKWSWETAQLLAAMKPRRRTARQGEA